MLAKKTPLLAEHKEIVLCPRENLKLPYVEILETGEQRHAITVASNMLGKNNAWLSQNYNSTARKPMRERWREIALELVKKGKLKKGTTFTGDLVLVEVTNRQNSYACHFKTISASDLYIILVSEAKRLNLTAQNILNYLKWEAE